MLTVALRLRGGESIVKRYCIGEIDSAKDTTHILKNTFLEKLNEHLKLLASGKFIITQDGEGKYGVEFASASINSGTTTIKSVDSKIFLCGDAKFYMQVLGRENSAPHWCVWCTINVRQFDFVHYPSTTQWTLPLMQAHLLQNFVGPKQLGIYSLPLFDFCKIDNILPNVLHEKINTGNDLIACIRSYTDQRIEMITEEESVARTASLAAEIALEECKESIEQYSFAIQAMHVTIEYLDATRRAAGGSFTED